MQTIPFTTRLAVTEDAAVISQQRRLMFTDAGQGDARIDSRILDVMEKHHEPWVAERIADGRYTGWLIEDGDRIVAGAGMLLLDWPPHFLDPETAQRAYVLNVYVDPEYRRHRLGRHLMEKVLEDAHRRGIRVVSLHATPKGRPLYEALGFHATNEMHFVETLELPEGSAPEDSAKAR
jgi:GNAT superfamily N-acetyltransferase